MIVNMLPFSVRILAVDYGTKRIGLAVYDSSAPVVVPKKPINVQSMDAALTCLCKLIDEDVIDTVLLGLPLNMDGTESDMTKQVRKFSVMLQKRTDCPVRLVDERLSSVMAEEKADRRVLKKRDGRIDSLAAAEILNEYVRNHI